MSRKAQEAPADTPSLSEIWMPQPGPQALAVTCPGDQIFFGGARGGGKFLSNSSRLLTPKGWITHGEVKVGDTISDPSTGGSQEVIGVYPQGEVDIYRVRFDDGAEVHAGLEHLWAYKCANRKRPGSKKSKQRERCKELGVQYSDTRFDYLRVGTTETLIKEIESGERKGKNHNPRVPLTNPVMFDVNGRTGEGEISPYFIGLMLGDGSFSQKRSGHKCSTGDSEIAAYLRSMGFEQRPDRDIDFYLPTGARLSRPFTLWLNNHGLARKGSKDKFIPSYVFTADVEYRLRVLQGLLDSDGYVDSRGHIEFRSVSEHLIVGVRDLVRSFGGKATVSEPIRGAYRDQDGERVECQFYRRVHIRSNLASHFFGLSRKKERCNDKWNGGHENMRKVVSIEYSHREEATCIQVSALHGLYITDDYVVTHNTDCAIGRQIIGAINHGHGWNGLFIRKNYKHFHELRRRLDELISKGLPARRTGGPSQTNYLYFHNGAQIMLTAMETPDKLDFFMGSQFTEISVEEAPTFPFIDQIIDQLNGCLRSPHGIKCTMFLTGNPGGPGHNYIKTRFITPAPGGGIPVKEHENADTKVFIPSNVEDNRILVENDPNYKQKLESIEDPELRRAWLQGDWDVILGGFFDDIWNTQKNKIVIPYFRPPKHWDRMVGFDWGSARPFSVGWYAISGGEYIPELGRALPRGALVRYYEWYGCVKERPNTGLRMESRDVARYILELEQKHGLLGSAPPDRIADPAVFKQEDGPSIGEKMAEQGVVWRRGDNKRIPGWDIMRSLMRGEMSDWEVVRTDDGEDVIINAVYEPMFFVTENCPAWIRTVPVLERDEKEPEDVDCFVAGTMISTPDGERPVETIQIGDYVNTPLGSRRVTNNFCQGPCRTHVVEMNNGRVLEGTPHHKIFCRGVGLQPLCMIPSSKETEDLTLEEGVCHKMQSIIEASSLEENLEGDTSSAIKRLTNGMDLARRYSIASYGKTTTEKFLQDTTSITRTTTHRTTTLKTLNSLLRAITLDDTSKKELNTVTIPQIVQHLLHGGVLQRENFSFGRMLAKCVKELPKENLRAQIVAALLEHDIIADTTAMSAERSDALRMNTLSGKSAQSAGNNIELAATGNEPRRRVGLSAVGSCAGSDTDMAISSSARSAARPFMPKRNEKPAAASVVRSYASSEKKLVYNLEVEQSRLYFAEKVLVSNTTGEDHIADETRYVCASRPGYGKSTLDIPESKAPMELEHEEIQSIEAASDDMELPNTYWDIPDDPMQDSFSAEDEITGA